MNHRNPQDTVVVTGMGVISCLGCTLDAVVDALRCGRSGVTIDPARQGVFRSPLTGWIADFDPKAHGVTRKLARTMGQPAQYAYAAATQAIAHAGLTADQLAHPRTGLILGNDSTVHAAADAVASVEKTGETHTLGAGGIFQSMNSTATMNLASAFGVGGANWTLSAACASGAHAVGQGLMLIRSGLQDVVIVGGTQETNWQSMASFDALGAFSMRCDDPHAASRPFDRDRDGLVPSGGAACLVLESASHARRRGAAPLAEVAGYGFSSQVGPTMSAPAADGAARAMQLALDDARLTPGDIDYINAHATSTLIGDRAEAAAIARICGSDTPVSSTKSLTGHECWMSGASELLYTILMVSNGFLAGNANFNGPGPDDPIIGVFAQTREARVRAVLSNSFGFGGTNACVALKFDR